VHVQRADEKGNAHIWGLTGMQAEAAFAAVRVIVVAEEIVDAVVHEPYGAHPSYAQGYYDRDTQFYLAWDPISRDHQALSAWLDEWVYGLSGRADYVEKMGAQAWDKLQPGDAWSGQVNYGQYR
jgi:glutaconate CoA-transferase subunit A